MPKLAAFFLFVAISSLGCRCSMGLSANTWSARHVPAALAVGFVGRTRRDPFACYLLCRINGCSFGEITRENRTLPDASAREKWILVTMRSSRCGWALAQRFITARTASRAQSVIDEVEPQAAV